MALGLDDNSPRPQLSVVVPVYNEEECIPALLDEIRDVLDAIEGSAEIVIVDDGSTDGTADVLRAWASEDDRLRIIRHGENSGQGAALYNGLRAARGETIVTLDGDGQNVPADIPRLLRALEGTDLVVGIRQGRRDSRLRRWMSKVANAVRSRILGDGVRDSGCALKAMRRAAVDALIPMQTLYSFVPALVAGGGFRVCEIPVEHRERAGGTSNYGLRKMLWRPLVDMLGVCWFNRRRINPRTRAVGSWPLVAIFIALAYFLFLGSHGLLEPDEGRYAQVAHEMYLSGNLVTPSLNGFAHVEKPPVIYWLTALSYTLFGVSEFSARLPSALAALGTILLTFQIGRDLGGRVAGWLAAIILASTLQFFLMARLISADMMMCFWITAAIACAVKHHVGNGARPAYAWLFFICMGIGFLTKGPMALVVPLSAALGLGWGTRGRARLPWLRGAVLCLAIALSWFIAISIANPSLWGYFLQTELRDRFLSSNHGRSQPFWFFLPILFIGFFPWTFVLIPRFFRWMKHRPKLAADGRLLLFWLAIPLLILSLSGSKLVTYVLPLFPALAVLTGLAISRGQIPGRFTLRYLGVAIIGLAAGLLCWRYLAPSDIAFDASLASLAVVAGAGAVLAFGFSSRAASPAGRAPALAACAILVWLALSSQVGQVNHLLGRQASVRELAGALRARPDFPRSRIIASNIRAHGVEFYLERPVDVTRGQADLVLPPTQSQTRRLHRSSKSVAGISPRTVKATFVITRATDWDKHYDATGRWKRLEQSGDFVLLKLAAGRAELTAN